MNSQRHDHYSYYIVLAALIYSLALGILQYSSKFDLPLAHIIALSTACFAFMGFDKNFARKGASRIPEKIFYLLGILGGSPGILVGTNVFRHKTRKAKFQMILLVIFAIQLAIFGFFSSLY